MTDFLMTESEVEEITGYKSKARQCKWLTNHGWTFDVSGTGRVIISRAYANQKLGFVCQTGSQKTAPKLNFDAIRLRKR